MSGGIRTDSADRPRSGPTPYHDGIHGVWDDVPVRPETAEPTTTDHIGELQRLVRIGRDAEAELQRMGVRA